MKKLLRRYLDYIYFDMVDKRIAAQIDHSLEPSAAVYLDLGCHIGHNTDRVRQALRPRQTLGLEYNPGPAKQALARNIKVARNDLNQPLPFPDNFADVITAFDVLEHLTETWLCVTEIYRVLKPGGIVVIDCPNLAAWHNIFTLLLGYQPTTGPHLISIADSDLKVVQDMHRRDHNIQEEAPEQEVFSASKMHRHLVVPTYKSLRGVLQKAGFHIEGSWGFGYYPFPPIIGDILCKLDIGHAHHYIIKARKPY